MTVAATGHLTPPRVDERSMPSGTALRFVLLVVLIVVSSASMMILTLGAGPDPGSSAPRTGSKDGCVLAAGGDPSRLGEVAPQADTSAYRECMDRYGPKDTTLWWPSEVWPVLMVIVAAVLMWAIPAWKARRGRVVPLEAVDGDGSVRGALTELAATAGLERAPQVVVDPAAASAGAVVFGSNRRPVLCLHGGLLVRARTDPEGFRAVLLHEFAHIRNGDVTLTYLTVALWRAFLGVVLLPYVALMLGLSVWMGLFALGLRAPLSPEKMVGIDSTWPLMARLLGLAGVLVLLVHLARADVLRSREIHADLTAVRWGAAPHHWAAHAVGHGAAAAPRGAVRRLRASFAELLRTHPRWDLRRDALADPAELFGVRALPMFLTGVTVPVINAQVWFYAAGAHSIPLLTKAFWVVTAALVAGVAGVALWRAAAHAVLTMRREPTGVRAGLWLGVGMTAGELVAYQSGTNTWLPGNPVMLLFPLAAGAAFGWWTTQCARLWTGARPERIRPLLLVGAVAGATVLTSWFAWWQVFGVAYAHAGLPSAAAMRAVLVHGLSPGQIAEQDGILDGMAALWPAMTALNHWALSLTAVTALWLLPLTAWVLRSTADHGTAPLRAALPPLRRVLLPSLLGAALATIAVAVVMAYMHTWQPPPAERGRPHLWIQLAWVLMLLVAAATAAAAAAAALTDRYRLLCALIAAQTTVLAGFAGAFVLASLDGCITPLNALQSSCSLHPDAAVRRGFRLIMGPTPILAALTATVAAAVVSLLHKVLTARRTRTAAASVPGRRHPVRDRLPARRLCVGILCAAALALTATDLFNPVASRSTAHAATPGQKRTAAAPSPRTHALQVYAWETYGGLRLERRLITISRGLDPLIQDPHAIDESRTRAQCAKFRRFADDAARYFPVPDPRSQASWRRAQTYATRGAANCDRALDRASGHLFATALNEFTEAMKSMGATSARNRSIVKRAGILEPRHG